MRSGTIEPTRAPAAGFSLVELMVTISLIAVLATVVVVAVNAARETANAAATKTTLSSISMGLQQFENDFDAYPRSFFPDGTSFAGDNDGWEGGAILAQMMVGPAHNVSSPPPPNDGVDGPGYMEYRPNRRGFAPAGSGPVYGPYINIEDDSTLFEYENDRYVFNTNARDDEMAPVLYYRKQSGMQRGDLDESNASDRVWGPSGLYDTDHNEDLVAIANADAVEVGNGPNAVVEGYWAKQQSNGGPTDKQREQFETALRAAEYLLVAPGPDNTFGTADDVYQTGP